MAIIVRPVSGRKEMKQFVKFRISLYRDSPYAIPPLYMDELTTLDRKKNPAFEFCEAQCFMAFDGERPVGRICAMVNHRANEVWKTRSGRFGFVDFVDDEAVSRALFTAAEDWLKEKGMHAVHGPLGFTDLDQEGMLIEGFDQLGTMATIYNYPYYPAHIEKLGYAGDADWVEYRITFADAVPDRVRRVAELVMKKNKLHVLNFTSASKFIKDGYGQKLFELVNGAYSHLYGFTPLTQAQIDYYLKQYVPMLKLDFLWLVVDDNKELIAMGVAMPSLSKALQRAQGKLLPFGFMHLIRALKMRNPAIDMLLLAVRKDYQNKGASALIFYDGFGKLMKAGVKYAESNPELLDNTKMQSQWDGFEHVLHKRRRVYRKVLSQ